MMRLEKLGLFDVNNMKRGHYLKSSGLFSEGTEYGPLLTDGTMYCCPQCGGHGINLKVETCDYCEGKGEIALNDPRVIQTADELQAKLKGE